MRKEEYLQELEKRLKFIPAEDRQDAIEYYDAYISDMGLTENDDVAAALGSPKDVAKTIIGECTQKHIDNPEEQKTVKGKATVIWLTVLGILSLPLSLPLGIAVLAVAFALIVTVFAVLFSLVISAFAVAVGGAASIIWGVFVAGTGQKLFTIGAGLLMTGFGLLLGCLMITLIQKLGNVIYRRNRNKEVSYE